MSTQKILPAKQTKQNNLGSAPVKQQTFLDHVNELRVRIFIVIATLVVAASIGYSFHDFLVRVLLAPLHGEKLVYLTPGGGFDFIFKVSLYFGVIITIPVFIYHAYKYLTPLMRKPTKAFALFSIIGSIVFSLSGIAFGYLVAVPAALRFLTNFGGEYIEASLTASSYLDFITTYMLGLALVFQLPLLLLFINAIGRPLPPSKLLKGEGYVVLGAFIAAALITPTPDVMNQAIIAAPIVIIYQLGILFVWVHNKSGRKRQAVIAPQQAAVPVVAQVNPAPAAAPVRSAVGVQASVAKPVMPRRKPAASMDIISSRPVGRASVPLLSRKPTQAMTAQRERGPSMLQRTTKLAVRRPVRIDGFFAPST